MYHIDLIKGRWVKGEKGQGIAIRISIMPMQNQVSMVLYFCWSLALLFARADPTEIIVTAANMKEE